MKIYNEIATIKSNHQIAYNIFESHMYSPNISSVVKPGQFINILPSKDWNKIMRRPMSVAWQKDGKISIIYKIFGEGTEVRDYLYIQDLVKVTEYFIHNNLSGTYLLGTGQSRSFVDIIECIKEITQRNVKTDRIEQKQPKINQKLNVQKLIKAFPGLSFIAFREGMRNTFEHAKN